MTKLKVKGLKWQKLKVRGSVLDFAKKKREFWKWVNDVATDMAQWERSNNKCYALVFRYILAVNPRVARDNYFYGGFIKKKFTI